MQTSRSFWLWHGLWVGGLLIGLAVVGLYSWLPADGATGDLESFTPQGFRVQWLFEKREGGLQVEDVIVRAGGHTVEEWLRGAPRGPEWREGGVVSYEILRDGRPMTLEIRLAPVPLHAILDRWILQLAVAMTFVVVGTFVFWRRPQELAARLLLFFCVIMALQYLGDAYNFQYATIPWRWPFWFQLIYEHGMYSLGLATICYFAMVFPVSPPLLQRFPHLLPFVLYASFPLVIVGAMALSSTWSAALRNGNNGAWVIAIVEVLLALGFGIRSTRTVRDPVIRAQVRWIVWCACVGIGVLLPGYVLPLMFSGRALLPHPVTMLFIALIPFALAIAILRYRLFDIEIIINRTLVYGTLTALLIGLYLLLVRLLTLVVQLASPLVSSRGNDTLVVFLATLSIALAFAPLRRRVQAVIDRTFYRTKLDFQRLLPEMSERLATSIDLDRLSMLLTKELPQRLQAAWARLAVLDPSGEQLVYVGSSDGPSSLPTDHPLVVYLQHSGRPLLRLQPPSDLPGEGRAFLDQQGIELSIPLIVGAEQVGLYNLGAKLSGNAYSRDEVRLLHILGQQAAVAAQNSRLFQAEREQRRLAEALQQAANVVSSTLDLDQVLDRILEQVEQVVEGDAFNVMFIEGGKAQVVRWRGYERLVAESRIAHLVLPTADYSTLTQMSRSGNPLVIPDTAADPAWIPLEGWEWLRSYLSAPIRVAGRTVGFLNVDGTRAGQFDLADAHRLEAFAHHAAMALENARLYEQAQQEIAERKEAEERLQVSLQEKEILLREIHHRVKNNLQVISSLLYLQSKEIEDKETLEMFLESQHRVRSMALVHERLYRTEDLAKVDGAEYIRDLVGYLHRSYSAAAGLIKSTVKVDDSSLGIDTAIPCGLIINELVSNSLKHAFPDGREGQVLVQLGLDSDGVYTLIISDDGVGLPESLDFRNTKSLGLRLVNTLVDQLGGTIELDRSGGTAFMITFTAPGDRGDV
jgi:two-component sensor histidine kinase